MLDKLLSIQSADFSPSLLLFGERLDKTGELPNDTNHPIASSFDVNETDSGRSCFWSFKVADKKQFKLVFRRRKLDSSHYFTASDDSESYTYVLIIKFSFKFKRI